jgi:hypothetical protein
LDVGLHFATLPRDPMDPATDRAYPRSLRMARRVFACAWLVALAGALAACDSPDCIPGDRQGCRCADSTYGYLTCPTGGHYPTDAACDCIRGLSPDASSE